MNQQPFITLASSAARTASGNGDALDLTQFFAPGGMPPMLLVQSNVSAISGTATPTVTIVIEDSLDGGAAWNTIGTFTAQTTTNRLVIQIALSGVAQAAGFRWPFNAQKVRARWTISGTNPSITFDVKCVPM